MRYCLRAPGSGGARDQGRTTSGALMTHDDGTGAQVVRALHDAFNDRDEERFLGLLAEDVTWHVEGDHPMAGAYTGRDGAWDGYFGPMWASPARYGDGQVLSHGEHAVALTEMFHNFGQGERGWKTVEVLRIADGKVVERWASTSGQGELDTFLTRGCEAAAEANLPR